MENVSKDLLGCVTGEGKRRLLLWPTYMEFAGLFFFFFCLLALLEAMTGQALHRK